MEKVKLPREVAEAIEHCKNQHLQFTNRVIMRIHMEDDGSPVKGVHQKALQSVDTDVLMQALVNGYEVEQTPEDKVRWYITSLIGMRDSKDRHPVDSKIDHSAIVGALQILEYLNIKIDGVNA